MDPLDLELAVVEGRAMLAAFRKERGLDAAEEVGLTDAIASLLHAARAAGPDATEVVADVMYAVGEFWEAVGGVVRPLPVDIRLGCNLRGRLEVLFGAVVEVDTERLHGKGGHGINYRHVIGGLMRKPGAFRRYRYRDALFPTQTFRRAYERLTADRSEWAADVEYLRIVNLAATTMECDVAAALDALLAAGTCPSLDLVRARVAPATPTAPLLEAPVVDLRTYDSLIESIPGRVA